MTDRKYYLWLIPGVLVLGMVFALVFAFQPVFAGSETNLNSIQEAQGAAVPQAELDPACTLDTTTSLAIAHWPLDETSGSTFDNALGAAALDGTCSGDSCPSPISGTNAGGQFFIDTDDDGITVPTNVAFDFMAADSFSAGVWVKTTQSCSGNKVYIGRYGTANTEGRWWLGCVPGSSPGEGVARFHMRDSTYANVRRATGSTQINDGEWHYLTGVWDGTDTRLYVDGSLETTISSPAFSGNFNSTKPVTIGEFDGSYNVTGALDEAAVFDSALDSTFIGTYMSTCSFDIDVGDVTFNTSMNTPIPITAAELLANSQGSLTLTAVDSSSEKGGGIAGSVPAGPFTYTPDTGYVGTDFFTFQVSDGVDTAWGTAIITMESPQVTNPGPQTDYEGAAVDLQIVAVDPNGDTMTYAAAGLPPGLSINVNTGLISGNVAAGASSLSPYAVTVTVTDENAHATPVDFAWTITPNDIPDVTPIDDQNSAEGQTITPLQVVASDGDSDTLTHGATNLPPGLTINPTSGLISGTVGAGASAASPYSVVVTVSDGKAAPVEAPFGWTITGGNAPPVVVKPADQVNFEGDPVSLQVQASDPNSDTLTYSATGLPPGLSINPTSGLISGTIGAGSSSFSPFTVKVRATDPGTLFDEQEFSWQVSTGVSIYLPLILR